MPSLTMSNPSASREGRGRQCTKPIVPSITHSSLTLSILVNLPFLFYLFNSLMFKFHLLSNCSYYLYRFISTIGATNCGATRATSYCAFSDNGQSFDFKWINSC